MRFEFSTAQRIVFGAGSIRQGAATTSPMGARALVVTGKKLDRARALFDSFDRGSLQYETFQVDHEPTVELVSAGVVEAKRQGCDWVIACGGGSVIDAGKAIAALMTNPGDPFDYLEVIGQGKALGNDPSPFAAIPTTAGTGAEATRNAVLASPKHAVKASLRSQRMLPSLAIIDPALACSLPMEITASTGLDALTQLIEPFVCTRANPLTDAFCRDGLPRIARSLRRACEEPESIPARTDMAWASLLSGMALANSGLGVVHALAAPIGGMFSAPHGAVCAALLPHAMELNLIRLRATAQHSTAIERYEEVARLLTGKRKASAEDGIEWIAEFCQTVCIPSLSKYGLESNHLESIALKAAATSSMKANPVALTRADLEIVLERALQ